jgi:hypothetical protein
VRVNRAEIELEVARERGGLLGLLLNLPLGAVADIATGVVGGDDVRWFGHVDVRPPRERKSHPVQRAVVRRLFSMLWSTLNIQNDPLGLIDPGAGPPAEQSRNPRRVGDVPRVASGAEPPEEALTAMFAEEKKFKPAPSPGVPDPEKFEALLEDPAKRDYTLHFRLRVEDQET